MSLSASIDRLDLFNERLDQTATLLEATANTLCGELPPEPVNPDRQLDKVQYSQLNGLEGRILRAAQLQDRLQRATTRINEGLVGVEPSMSNMPGRVERAY